MDPRKQLIEAPKLPSISDDIFRNPSLDFDNETEAQISLSRKHHLRRKNSISDSSKNTAEYGFENGRESNSRPPTSHEYRPNKSGNGFGSGTDWAIASSFSLPGTAMSTRSMTLSLDENRPIVTVDEFNKTYEEATKEKTKSKSNKSCLKKMALALILGFAFVCIAILVAIVMTFQEGTGGGGKSSSSSETLETTTVHYQRSSTINPQATTLNFDSAATTQHPFQTTLNMGTMSGQSRTSNVYDDEGATTREQIRTTVDSERTFGLNTTIHERFTTNSNSRSTITPETTSLSHRDPATTPELTEYPETTARSTVTTTSPSLVIDLAENTTYGISTHVRLSHGSYGLLEVFYNGHWGTVTDDPLYDQDGVCDVVCRQLGFRSGYFSGSAFYVRSGCEEQGTEIISFDLTYCIGHEVDLLDCSFDYPAPNDDSHREDTNCQCCNSDQSCGYQC